MYVKYVLIALGIFCLAAVLDWIWAEYISWVAKKNAAKASLFAGLIYCVGGWITIAYTHNHLALVPAILGSMAGTYISVKKQGDKDGNQDKR